MYQEKGRIRGLIFDLDGTLAYTRGANFKAYQSAFSHFNIQITQKQYDSVFGCRIDQLLKRLAPELTLKQQSRLKALKIKYYKRNLDKIRANETLVKFVQMFQSNYSTALVTAASRASATVTLKAIGLHNVFDLVVCGEDVKAPKPSPDCYIHCMKKLQIAPGESLIFEDSAIGVLAATRSGAHVIRVPEVSI